MVDFCHFGVDLNTMADLTPGQKAAQTRKWRAAGAKAAQTKKRKKIILKIRASERASKEKLREHYEADGWKVAFFEGPTGNPRTGIIDAVAFRLAKSDADSLHLRLIQLKGGSSGITAAEIRRLKAAARETNVGWIIAAFDGEALHLVPEETAVSSRPRAKR
jgi:hypothetical protein